MEFSTRPVDSAILAIDQLVDDVRTLQGEIQNPSFRFLAVAKRPYT